MCTSEYESCGQWKPAGGTEVVGCIPTRFCGATNVDMIKDDGSGGKTPLKGIALVNCKQGAKTLPTPPAKTDAGTDVKGGTDNKDGNAVSLGAASIVAALAVSYAM